MGSQNLASLWISEQVAKPHSVICLFLIAAGLISTLCGLPRSIAVACGVVVIAVGLTTAATYITGSNGTSSPVSCRRTRSLVTEPRPRFA